MEYRYVVFKNGEQYSEGDLRTVDFMEGEDLSRISITHRLTLGKEMAPGKYEFRIIVTDKQAKKNYSTATRTLKFEVL